MCKLIYRYHVNTAWNNSANWGGCLPDCNIGVIIPDDGPLPFSPTIGGYGVNVDDLQLEQNSILTVNTGSTVNICGTFAHAGSLVIGGGASPTFTFGGTTKQFYAKTSTGSGDLANVVINNPADVEVYDDAGYQDLSLNSSSTLTLTNGVLSTKNTREVYIKNSSTAAISGFGTSSYISGRLRRAVAVSASAYDFPVGNANAYERMSIQVNGVSGGLISLLAYFENLSGNDGSGWGSLSDAGTSFITTASPTIPVNIGGVNATTGHANAGVWTVVPNAGSADYNMTLYGRNYSNAGTATHTIVKRNQFTCSSPNWSLSGTYSGSSVASNVVTVTRTGLSGFSQFGIGRHSAPLPIDLLFFDASCSNDNEVKITWITATEINNDYFTVERSFDNADSFEPIKITDGAGNSTDSRQYSFIDESFPGGTCYYRLKQTDFDGNYEYFTPVSTSCGRSEQFAVISIVPNPAKEDLFIFYNSYEADNVVTVFITDVLGKLVFSEKMIPQEGLNQMKINISNYSNGIYYVNVNNGTKSHVEKIVKQD